MGPENRETREIVAKRSGNAQLVVLVRHAATAWSESGQHTGRTDILLNETGRRVAAELATRLAGLNGAFVLSSPLSRALDTARLAGFADPIETTEDLLEWDYGEYEGLTSAQIEERRPGWNLFVDGCPGGEQADDVVSRVDRVLERIEGEAAKPTVLFAHGHVLRVLGARWAGLPPDAGQRLALDAPSVSELGYEHDLRVLRRWNT